MDRLRLHRLVEPLLRVGGEGDRVRRAVDGNAEVAVASLQLVREPFRLLHFGVGELLLLRELLQTLHPQLIRRPQLVALVAELRHFVGELRRVLRG